MFWILSLLFAVADAKSCHDSITEVDLYRWRTPCTELCDWYSEGNGRWYCMAHTGLSVLLDEVVTECITQFHPKQCRLIEDVLTTDLVTSSELFLKTTTPELTTTVVESTTAVESTTEASTTTTEASTSTTEASTSTTEASTSTTEASTSTTEASTSTTEASTSTTEASTSTTEESTTTTSVVESTSTIMDSTSSEPETELASSTLAASSSSTTGAKATQGRRTSTAAVANVSEEGSSLSSSFLSEKANTFSSETQQADSSSQGTQLYTSAESTAVEECMLFFEDRLNGPTCQVYCQLYSVHSPWCIGYDISTFEGLLECIYVYHSVVCEPGVASRGTL